MAYLYHPQFYYAATDGGAALGYDPHQIYGQPLPTYLPTVGFPIPYVAAALPPPPPPPVIFLPHYIYCGQPVSYNLPSDFAGGGGAEPPLLHHHSTVNQETTFFQDVPATHDDEVIILDGDLLSPVAPSPRRDDAMPEEVVSEFLKKMSCEEGGEEENCAVCQDELCREKDEKIVALDCRHRFHGDCVGKWLQMKNSCPLCKAIAIHDY